MVGGGLPLTGGEEIPEMKIQPKVTQTRSKTKLGAQNWHQGSFYFFWFIFCVLDLNYFRTEKGETCSLLGSERKSNLNVSTTSSFNWRSKGSFKKVKGVGFEKNDLVSGHCIAVKLIRQNICQACVEELTWAYLGGLSPTIGGLSTSPRWRSWRRSGFCLWQSWSLLSQHLFGVDDWHPYDDHHG